MAAPSLRIDVDDPTPPYEQLRRQLVALIASGAVPPGERLPPVRQLAADLGLAAGTVARAYRELEAEGLVATRRGGGTRVRRPPAPTSDAGTAAALRVHADALVQAARLIDADDGQVRAAVEAALAAGRAAAPGG